MTDSSRREINWSGQRYQRKAIYRIQIEVDGSEIVGFYDFLFPYFGHDDQVELQEGEENTTLIKKGQNHTCNHYLDSPWSWRGKNPVPPSQLFYPRVQVLLPHLPWY